MPTVVLCALVFRISPLELKLCLFCAEIDVTCLQCYKRQFGFLFIKNEIKMKNLFVIKPTGG